MKGRRNAKAAKRFLRELMRRWGSPRALVTDKLPGYGAARRALCPNADHRAHKGLNNRVGASHRHTRRREKIMGRFKSPVRPSASSPSMIKLPLSFAPNDTASPQHPIATPEPTRSACGTTRPANWLPDHAQQHYSRQRKIT